MNEKRLEYQRKYYQDHKEEILKKRKQREDPEKKIDYCKKYYQTHKEELQEKQKTPEKREKRRQYYKANREKIAKQSHARYEKNPQKFLERHKAYIKANPHIKVNWSKKTYDEKMNYFRKYKAERGCIICGEKDPLVLDFHHREPSDKKHSIMYMISGEYSVSKILEEIKKCDVVCANDHRRIHNGEHPNDN